jgi:two-component system, chemotaxis family, CheB/CheR fusion protein
MSQKSTVPVSAQPFSLNLTANNPGVIPAGSYVPVLDGVLRLSKRDAHHGAHLPFDFLPHTRAEEYGARSMSFCVEPSPDGYPGMMTLTELRPEHGGAVAFTKPIDPAASPSVGDAA